MAIPNRQRSHPPTSQSSERMLGELMTQVETTAAQLSQLTNQVAKIAETVNTLSTAVQVAQVHTGNMKDTVEEVQRDTMRIIAQLKAQIDGLQKRREYEQDTAQQNGFMKGANVVNWGIMITLFVIGQFLSALIYGHITFK